MLNPIDSNLDAYYKLNKYSNKKVFSKASFAKEILKGEEDEKQKASNINNKKEDGKEDGNMISKIITGADGTRILLLIKNSTVVTQIKLGKALDEFKEDNEKNESQDSGVNNITRVTPATIENEEVASTDLI